MRSPAPASSLGNGWRYKGCYSDTLWSSTTTPHALNGSFTRINPNGGVQCTAICRQQSYRYAGTNDNQCWCGNVINPSNAATAGILAPDISCQGSCRGGNTNEACGAMDTFISIYEYTKTIKVVQPKSYGPAAQFH
ncbi:hypothetical protein E8E11_002018 [Didymella keratinophila]|nr:hypothetical protein E8E11_002018 [Didymella keratinophila]